MSIIIIAEAGVNHNGEIKKALKMVDIAANVKANFIKFQTFIPEKMVVSNFALASYQKKNTKFLNQYQMLEKLKLSYNDFKKIKKRCYEKKIKFISSPFDLDSIDFLSRLKIKYIKIPSGEITNVPYLKKIGKLNIKVILSSGMSNINEIKEAIKILVRNGTKKSNITVLHCSTQYPAPHNELNLKSIKFIKDKIDINVGYSDHSLGYEASLIALGLGATILEKHFTLNKQLSGPDHKASLSPKELKNYILKIRDFEKSIGQYQKKPSLTEKKNMTFIRKKIVAQEDIKIGEIFSIKNLTTKRSATGICASKWEKVMGKESRYRFIKNQGIKI